MRELFEQVYDRRHTQSIKWDRIEQVYNVSNGDDILPMWIADMDFAAPPVVVDAIRERLDHPIFGYSYASDRCKDALVHWVQRRYDWTIQREQIMFQHGVIPALALAIETFTSPGDAVMMTPPIYPPFFTIPTGQERRVVYSPLIERNGTYDIHFEHFEEMIVTERVKAFILCNPHNPSGRVWTKQELQTLLTICRRHHVLIISDEIHADLVFAPNRHVPIATLATAEDALVTCVAPTKTFNLAGIQAAAIISENRQRLRQLKRTANRQGQMALSTLATTAFQAAYEEGEPWLETLHLVLLEHFEYVQQTLQRVIPQLQIAQPESTYLMWIDYRQTGHSEEEVMNALLHVGRVALEPGSKYGDEGRGFLRMNVATPTATLRDGVERIIRAFEHLRSHA